MTAKCVSKLKYIFNNTFDFLLILPFQLHFHPFQISFHAIMKRQTQGLPRALQEILFLNTIITLTCPFFLRDLIFSSQFTHLFSPLSIILRDIMEKIKLFLKGCRESEKEDKNFRGCDRKFFNYERPKNSLAIDYPFTFETLTH